MQPGDYVDVFLVLRRDNQEIGASHARMLLPRLRVLAYGGGAVNEPNKEQPEQMMTRREAPRPPYCPCRWNRSASWPWRSSPDAC